MNPRAYNKQSSKDTTAKKTFLSKEKEEEQKGKAKEREKGATSPLIAEDTTETTEIGGGEQEQQIITNTPSKIHFETLAYASMWPKSSPCIDEMID